MSDDPNNRGPADGKRINIHQEHEVNYWTAEELREAVAAVGVMADKVREHLQKKKKK
jgi:hypothetical protein